MRGLISTLQRAFAAEFRLDEYWDQNLAQRAVEHSRDFAFSDTSGKALDRLLGSLGVRPEPEARAVREIITPVSCSRVSGEELERVDHAAEDLVGGLRAPSG